MCFIKVSSSQSPAKRKWKNTNAAWRKRPAATEFWFNYRRVTFLWFINCHGPHNCPASLQPHPMMFMLSVCQHRQFHFSSTIRCNSIILAWDNLNQKCFWARLQLVEVNESSEKISIGVIYDSIQSQLYFHISSATKAKKFSTHTLSRPQRSLQ